MAKPFSDADSDLLKAFAHPIRLAIMRAAVDTFSPRQLADTLDDVPLQIVSHHVRVLRDAGLLTLTGEEPRRGAIEHFYRASPDAATRLTAAGAIVSALGQDLEDIGPVKRPPNR